MMILLDRFSSATGPIDGVRVMSVMGCSSAVIARGEGIAGDRLQAGYRNAAMKIDGDR